MGLAKTFTGDYGNHRTFQGLCQTRIEMRSFQIKLVLENREASILRKAAVHRIDYTRCHNVFIGIKYPLRNLLVNGVLEDSLERLNRYSFYAVLMLICLSISACFIGCSLMPTPDKDYYEKNTGVLGVWWWHDELIKEDKYLDFAARNSVNEIYLCTEDFSQETAAFISKAGTKGMKVFLLAGDYRYIYDKAPLDTLIVKYAEYQKSTAPSEKFSGVHLDVEPHQDPAFSANRKNILNTYLHFVIDVCAEYETDLDFDIPFWFDDEVPYRGNTVKLFEAVMSEANRVFVMSYRDTAEEMYEAAKDEIAFAKKHNQEIILGAETYSEEGDHVSYFEEGKKYMYAELAKLHGFIDYKNYGIAIHHIKTWFDLD
jgi:hypothetical protein